MVVNIIKMWANCNRFLWGTCQGNEFPCLYLEQLSEPRLGQTHFNRKRPSLQLAASFELSVLFSVNFSPIEDPKSCWDQQSARDEQNYNVPRQIADRSILQ